jgi:hypothetical protein
VPSKTDSIVEEVWSSWSAAIAWWLTFPGVQAWWKARPLPFTDSFTLFVEFLLKDNPTDADQNQRWQELISQNKPQIQGTSRQPEKERQQPFVTAAQVDIFKL